MIVTTGNNFGAGAIQFKDYQAEHEVVLNGSFEFRADSEAFQKADVLEIYVPDISLERSAISACYVAAKGPYAWMGTTCKCWFKNRNTLCIEKLDIWTNLPERKIWIFSLFGLRGFHDLQVEFTQMNSISLQQSESVGTIWDPRYYCGEHYVMLAIPFDSLTMFNPDQKVDLITNPTNPFPDDIDAEIPFVICQVSGAIPGVSMKDIVFRDGALLVRDIPKNMTYGTGYSPFIFVWVLRGEHSTQPDVEDRKRFQYAAQTQGSVRYTYLYDIDVEVLQLASVLGLRMSFSLGNNASVNFTIPEKSPAVQDFESFFLAKQNGSNALNIGLAKVKFEAGAANTKVTIDNAANCQYFYSKVVDTAVCVTSE